MEEIEAKIFLLCGIFFFNEHKVEITSVFLSEENNTTKQ